MDELYFRDEKYEKRVPEPYQPKSTINEFLFQFIATLTVVVGFWYIHYRWSASLNYDALWFSVPLAFAETMMFIGTILVMINFWKKADFDKQFVPNTMENVVEERYKKYYQNRRIKIDIYVPVFNEDPELVRYTVKDAKAVKSLDSWDVRVWLLDDSNNEAMAKMAEEEGIGSVIRDNTKGRKAGAMTYALDITRGDFVVIVDSDTRLFPNILMNTMGYFRDDAVAWVQTPQWFYDVPEGEPVERIWKRKMGKVGEVLGSISNRLFGKTNVGYDVFANEPQMFFDVIQGRRNALNASFCCGATSIHRTNAVKTVSISRWVDRVTKEKDLKKAVEDIDIEYFVYHTSEDIYTSMTIHAFKPKKYKSVLHTQVESKMLSPLDLLTWTTQRYRYAGGTIDLITKEFKQFFKRGLSLGQKLMYFNTFWSYTGAIWTFIFLLSPIIYLFTNVAPVDSYSMEFFKHLIPFLLLNQTALLIATWGIATNRGSQFFISIFPIVLQAFWDVARGKKISFVVTSKVKQAGDYLGLVKIQIFFIIMTLVAVLFNLILMIFEIRLNYTGFAVNALWSIYNINALMAIVKAAVYKNN